MCQKQPFTPHGPTCASDAHADVVLLRRQRADAGRVAGGSRTQTKIVTGRECRTAGRRRHDAAPFARTERFVREAHKLAPARVVLVRLIGLPVMLFGRYADSATS